MNDKQIEIQKPPAPCITPAGIEDCIAYETYFTAADGAIEADGDPGPKELSLLTFCVLVLSNGHTVTGASHCADPAKFNAKTGQVEARKRAIDALWPMVIYAERERLAREAPPTDHRDRVRAEFTELENKLGKLSNFLGSEKFQALQHEERSLLVRQFEAMLAYANVLADRIRNFGDAA